MIVITGRSEDVEKARDRILKIQSELVCFYSSVFVLKLIVFFFFCSTVN
jgi:hypothetical protein